MRTRHVKCSGELLGKFLCGESIPASTIVTPLPDGFRIASCGYNPATDELFIAVDHESFEDIADGGEVPVHPLIVETDEE